MLRFLKDLYLTVFTLGYKAGIAGNWERLNPKWGPSVDAGKGVFLIWIIAFFILMGIKDWVEICVGTKFSFDSSLWVKVAISFALYLPNYYILVIRGHGITFERKFNDIEKSRKILLVVSFAMLLLVTVAFSIYSISAYQHFFQIIPKRAFE